MTLGEKGGTPPGPQHSMWGAEDHQRMKEGVHLITLLMHLTLLSHRLHHRSNLETPQIFASTHLTPQELNQYEVVVKLITYAIVIFVPIKKPNEAFLHFSANSNKNKKVGIICLPRILL